MKLALLGSGCGLEIGAPQIVSPPKVLKWSRNPTGWPLAVFGTTWLTKVMMSVEYVGEPTWGVLFLIVGSGAGKVLPLTSVYGKISGSSRLISATPWPGQFWITCRWNICTGQPRKLKLREVGYPNVVIPPYCWKKAQMASSSMR